MINGLVFERIKRDINTNDVVLYMKGTAVFPQCGFSAALVQILSRLGVTFKEVNVLENRELHQALKVYASWPMTPQLYVKGEFIGGCDVVRAMYNTGEFQELLERFDLYDDQDVA